MTGALKQDRGFTYVELLMAVLIAGLLTLGLSGVVGQALQSRDVTHAKTDLARQAGEAMEQMVRATANSRLLLLPLADRSDTGWRENVREQTEPASPPETGSVKATAVLAVTLPLYSDLDGNGVPDADNDGDGRVDEDIPDDMQKDYAPGIYLIDDNGNGYVDDGLFNPGDDDEWLSVSGEDPLNGVDDDGDGSIDEDAPSDANKDGCPGVCGVDDDGDGNLDEGGSTDDDEDGSSDEDWYDPVVFYMQQGALYQRTPVPWDITGDGTVSGRDFITSVIAEHVTRFRVERVVPAGGAAQTVDLTLELTSPSSGEVVSLQTRVRIGGAL